MTASQRPSGPAAGELSVGELFGEISRDLSTLLRQEVELAKTEIKAEMSKAGKGVGLLGGAGFGGYMVLLFLSISLWWGLSNAMDQGWAALIVAAIWAAITAVLLVTGRGTLRTVNATPERTVDTVKQVPSALAGHDAAGR